MQAKRLNKFISDSGFCSRRDADKLLEQGRVTVNGKIPEPGMLVTSKDKVRIDDEILHVREEEPVFMVFNKPAGIASTTDLSVRNNIIQALNYPATLVPIGLMDRDAEGLLFLTNNSDLARRISKADNRYEKEYIVTVDKLINVDFLSKISQAGAFIPGEMKKKNFVVKEGTNRFRIVLEPGVNHHIKRLVEELGYKVVHLQRIRIANITPARLAVGHWRTLNEAEIEELKSVLSTRERRPASARNERDNFSERRPVSRSTSTRGGDNAAKPGRPGASASSKLKRSDNPKSAANRAGRKNSAARSRGTGSKSSALKTGGRKSR